VGPSDTIYIYIYIYIYIHTHTHTHTQGFPGGKVNILGGHSDGHSKQVLYMYLCPIPNDFRDSDVSLYSCKIVDKKKILRTVSNTGIYSPSDKVGTVYLVLYISKISPSTSMHFATRVRTWRVSRLYRLYSVLYSEIALSRKPFVIGHMYIYNFLLRMTDTITSENTDLSSWDTLYIIHII
jgi:hypothetical protein